GRVPYFGSRRADRLAQPRTGVVGPGFGRGDCAGVSLEERDVRAEAADRDGDRDRALARHRRESPGDQRRLAVAPRRDEEDLLTGGEIGHQPAQLVGSVDERRRRNHFAIDERIAGYVEHRSGYAV